MTAGFIVEIQRVSTSELEELAALEHDQWMTWSKALAAKGEVDADTLARWKPNWVPYAELSAAAKEQDRTWARQAAEIVKSNPEGINQYTYGAGGKGTGSEHSHPLRFGRELVGSVVHQHPGDNRKSGHTHAGEPAHKEPGQIRGFTPPGGRTYNLDAMARTMPKTDANRHAHSDYGGQRFHSHDEGQRSHSHEPGSVTQFFGKSIEVEIQKANPEGINQYTCAGCGNVDSHFAGAKSRSSAGQIAGKLLDHSAHNAREIDEAKQRAFAKFPGATPKQSSSADARARRILTITDSSGKSRGRPMGKGAAFTDDFRGEHETIVAGKVTVRRKPGDVVVSLSKDSTGADAQFHQADDGKWTYRMQRPDHNGDYGDSEIYDHHGPFPSFGKALAHMDSNYANPGGYGINAKFHREFAAETKPHYARTAQDPYNFKPAAGHNGSSPHDCKGPSCVAAVAKLNVAADKLDKEANSREDEARDDRGRWTKSIDIEVEKGDTPGHEFHGNQWTVGDGSDHEIKHVAAYDKGKVGPGMIGDHLLDVKSEGGHGLQTASGHNPTDRQKHEELHFGKVERVSQRPRGNTWREFHPKKSADVVVELAKYSDDQDRDERGRWAAMAAPMTGRNQEGKATHVHDAYGPHTHDTPNHGGDLVAGRPIYNKPVPAEAGHAHGAKSLVAEHVASYQGRGSMERTSLLNHLDFEHGMSPHEVAGVNLYTHPLADFHAQHETWHSAGLDAGHASGKARRG